MLLKKGVTLLGIKPELVIGLMVADAVYRMNDEELTVTSITDGKHSRKSRHYLGLAADLRTNNISELMTDVIALQIQQQLPEFFVLLEHKNSSNEHIHIQFNGAPIF